ncbi:hypothetical protein Hanom_Chr09g00867521 [Helianthus anomalus]
MDPPYRRVSIYTSIHAPRAVQRNPGASLSSFHIRYDSKLWGFLPLLPALRHKRKITLWGNLDSVTISTLFSYTNCFRDF